MYSNLLELIGNTPFLELNKINEKENLKSRIYAKLEFYNPGGSIKDRAVLNIINDLLESNKINNDSTIIEATSGNTGIALASICNYLGMKSIIVMPENMSEERKNILKAYGSELILTKKEDGMNGSVKKANELSEEIENSVILGQFSNINNLEAHYKTTARELEEEIDDLDYIVCGVGSGGTITGIAKYFKEKNKKTKIIAVEPADSPLLSKGTSGTHNIQGIGANFIPEILDLNLIDEIKITTYDEAKKYGKMMVMEEGLLIGISSAAALSVAVKIAQKEINKKIVVIFPDNGMKYLTTDYLK